MKVVEEYVDKDGEIKIKRMWYCCGETWEKELSPNDLEEVAWTPVCPYCGGFDGSLFA